MRTKMADEGLRPAALLVLVALVTSFYGASFANDFVYDDYEVVLEHQAPESLRDVAQLFAERHFPELPYYRPVTRTTLLLQKSLHGDRFAGPFHLANALLMGLTAWATYALLRLPVFRIQPLHALWGAALLAVHPVASSCVYPIASGRETLLPTLLGIAAVLGFLHGGRWWFAGGVASFAAALFSKEQAIILPGILLAADLLRVSTNSPRQLRRWLWRYGPLAGVVALYLLVRWQLFEGSELRWAVLDNPSGPLLSFGYAAQTAFVPFAELVYEPPFAVWFSPLRLLTAAIVLGLLITAAIRLERSSRSVVLFWCAWYLLALLPTGNLLEQEARFDERYVFPSLVPLIGLTAMVVSALSDTGWTRRIVGSVGIALVTVAAMISWNRAQYFGDEIAFHTQWVRTNPGAVDAHIHLGLARHRQGRLQEAKEHFEEALGVRPGYHGGHLNLGNLYLEQTRFAEAAEQYRLTIQATPYDGQRAHAHFNLGISLVAQGLLEEAAAAFRDAVRINPELLDARLALGSLLARQGESEAARVQFLFALKSVPAGSPAARDIQDALRRLDRSRSDESSNDKK
jgi:tetratricopeptide (TPR) repeat protein